MQIKVLVVDDHELVRVGMRRLLEDNPMIELIHESSSGEVALEMAVLTNYDLILMDINLPGMTGLEAAEQLLTLAPKSRVIMVTGRLEGSLIRQILNAGVRGYVSKGSSADEMEKAMRKVMEGEQYLSPDVAQRFAIDAIRGDDSNPFERLTTRETEIINRLLQGQRNRKIATDLHISEKTVSTHRTRAFEKLRITTTPELVRLAISFDKWHD
ncbi:response regulator transcription factor [Granulosicoccus sp.]|nr:response regulator transcription factor [Granulosicoccus sp.]MDB4223736.1 response regulator transcription factor [Granulosicoccus sp.]